MLLLAGKAPEVPCIQELTKIMELDKLRMNKLFDYVEAFGCFRILQAKEDLSQNRLCKSYLGNTNLLAALFRESERVYIGETFLVDQMSNISTVELLPNNDFLVADTYTFMTGDPLMDYERAKDMENAYAAIYGQPKSSGNKMPIWVLGLCY